MSQYHNENKNAGGGGGGGGYERSSNCAWPYPL